MSDSMSDWNSTASLTGTLLACVAGDWGEEIDIERARQLVPSEPQELSRRPRTPKSIAFRFTPLRVALPAVSLILPELGECQANADLTVFDFGATNITLRIKFQLSPAALTRLARSLSTPELLVASAQSAVAPFFERLRPAIAAPRLSDLSEEYFVFLFDPAALPAIPALLTNHASWLAGLVRLEDAPLSAEEVVEALRQRITYSACDLVVAEWAAAVVIDRDCDETLQTFEFANLQLLEYRHMDRRVDDALAAAYGSIHPLIRSRRPIWRTQTQPLRMLGDLRIETDLLFERTSSALKLLGDQYLARLHRILSARLHLDEWSMSIRASLDVAQGVYQILSDQAAAYRVELLEIIVIVLILIEIAMAFWAGHG